MKSSGLSLFDDELPDGGKYERDFLTPPEEARLGEQISAVEFSDFEMRGVVARRRVAFFGLAYDRADRPARPFPAFLSALRARAATWAGIEDDAIAMALINDYPPGAPIGWHRDAPQYGIVIGISFGSACRMRFRPYRRASSSTAPSSPRRATHELTLLPRSIYLLAGPARSAFEHSIPPVDAHRYSITFRTLARHAGVRMGQGPAFAKAPHGDDP
jgi:alkylated DNA repair dioxygenase AlkB